MSNYYPEAIKIICDEDTNSRALLVEICKNNPHAVVAAHNRLAGPWSVVLDDYGNRKIACIKALRSITGLGLKDAKELSETPSGVVLSSTDEHGAIDALAQLQETGAHAHIARGQQ